MKNAEEHFDLNVLRELRNIMGDEYPLLIETFVNDSVLRINTIADAVTAQDPDAIRRSAHSLKGSAGNMGAIKLSDLCRSLEESASGGLIEGSQRLLSELQLEYQKVAQILSDP